MLIIVIMNLLSIIINIMILLISFHLAVVSPARLHLAASHRAHNLDMVILRSLRGQIEAFFRREIVTVLIALKLFVAHVIVVIGGGVVLVVIIFCRLLLCKVIIVLVQ